LHDAAEAMRWLADESSATALNIDPERLAVAGESAGATLAAGDAAGTGRAGAATGGSPTRYWTAQPVTNPIHPRG